MALIVCYTVLHGKLIFVQSLREIFRSLIRQWHGREENAMTIYIYIHWSPIQYLERCFISYRFKVTHVGLIFFFLTRGVRASLRAPQFLGSLNILQAQWACKALRGWQTCTVRLQPWCRGKEQVSSTVGLQPQVHARMILHQLYLVLG
jgi:hypothetical protein